MGDLHITGLSKAYKRYPHKWARVGEWLTHRPRHEKIWVLRDVNFSVAPGESVGVVGVNGAGKSTLLKIITGTTQPTIGSVQHSGRIAALLELGMGFHPDFTGRQNIFMAGQLLGLSYAEIAERMAAIEAFAEIGDYLDRPVRIYSSGMQMRIAFAVATAVRPDILIVDEALSVGDAYFQARCFQRISEFKQQGTTLLLVSHSPTDIAKHCDRAILLSGGRIAHDSDARSVINHYLDELFGQPNHPADSAEDTPPLSAEAASGPLGPSQQDQFHTRAAYHRHEHRWGQGGAAIIDYLIRADGRDYPASITSNTVTEFYFKVRFERSFDSVVPGLLLKTLEGLFLYGTNAFIASSGQITLSAQAGEVKIFRFTLPLALNQGHYLVSFGISAGHPLHELTPLDRRYDAVLLTVDRTLVFWGLVDLHATFDTLC